MYRAMRKKTQCATSLIFLRIRKAPLLETILSFISSVSRSDAAFSWSSSPTCPGFHLSILALLWSPRGIRTHKRETSWRPDAGSFGYLYSCTSLHQPHQNLILIYNMMHVAYPQIDNVLLLNRLPQMKRSIHFILFYLLS
jgi:hypothetical protein